MEGEPPDLAIVPTDGFSARTILHGEILIERAGHGIGTNVASPDASSPWMEELRRPKGAHPIPAPDLDRRALDWIVPRRRDFLEDVRGHAILDTESTFRIADDRGAIVERERGKRDSPGR
jgi:hypothetical protein